MLDEIQDMQGEIFDVEAHIEANWEGIFADWCHPMAECWHDMDLNADQT